MQHDEVTWQVLNQHFCSFKVKTPKANFCKNQYNITGLCNRSACPLANSNYATIQEEKGICYLYIKTIERKHTPKDWWEKIKLPRNYAAALAIVDAQLKYMPKYQIHRNKQRLTKIHQYLIRMRKLKLQEGRLKIVGINTHKEAIEDRKEKKALKAARIDQSIEQELLSRLEKGTYDEDQYYPWQAMQKALDKVEGEHDDEKLDEALADAPDDEEIIKANPEEEEEEDEDVGIPTFVADFEPEDEDDIEDAGQQFEYEEEEETEGKTREKVSSSSSSSSSSAGRGTKRRYEEDVKSATGGKRKTARVELEVETEEEPRQRVKA